MLTKNEQACLSL